MSDISNDLSFVGQINLVKINIISSDGKRLDITTMLGDLTLYEDIFSNTMSGYAMIQDALDLIETLPMVGQELLEIELQTPTLENKITKTFYIYKLKSRITKKRSQSYILHFCSIELVNSENAKVSKSFSGAISDTVSSIFNDNRYMASKSKLVLEATKNEYKFIAPFWTPLETINWISNKAINKEGVPNYLFYENNQEFVYTSVDKLIKANPNKKFYYSDVDTNTAFGVNDSIDDKYSLVEIIQNDVTFDYLRNLNAGMYASKLYTLDLTTKNIGVTKFDYINDFDKSSHLGKVPLKSSSLNRKSDASVNFIPKNNYVTGKYKQQNYKDFFLQRNSLIEQLSAFKLNIKVHGRTDIKVGQTIDLELNQLRELLADEIDTDGKSKYFGGKYLITAIRHQIVVGKHIMYMEIIHDSFTKQLDNIK